MGTDSSLYLELEARCEGVICGTHLPQAWLLGPRQNRMLEAGRWLVPARTGLYNGPLAVCPDFIPNRLCSPT